MLLSFFAIIITKQRCQSRGWPFDSSPALYYKLSIDTMRLSCTVNRYGDYGVSKVGRTQGSTHERTLRWFYTISNVVHCTGQTI